MSLPPMPTADVGALNTALTYINTLDLFNAAERLAANSREGAAPKTNYQALLAHCEATRRKHGLRPAEATVANMAVDWRSEKQLRFVDALGKMGMVTDPLDYRWSYVGKVGGRSDEPERPVSTMASQATYILGLLSGRAEAMKTQPHVLVVAGVFDIYHSLADLVQNRGGKAILMFPRSLLDGRWAWVELGAPECPVIFEDMEPAVENIFGIKPDALPPRAPASRPGGLAKL